MKSRKVQKDSFVYFMNKTFLYQGFEELYLLCITLIKRNIKPDKICEEKEYFPNLFDEIIKINYLKLDFKIDKNVYKIIFEAYLSSDSLKELAIYYYLKNYFKYGTKIFYLRNLNCVNKIENLSHYVRRETHKMKGFLRFKVMKNNLLCASMAPENNIILPVSLHFSKRFKQEHFLIIDEKRKLYAFYDTKRITILNEDNIKSLDLIPSLKEENFDVLWKTFFDTIGIKERENKRCQTNNMPKKYWQYMVEMEDKL